MKWNFNKENMEKEVVATDWLNKSGVYPLIITEAKIEDSKQEGSKAQAVVLTCTTTEGTKAGDFKYWVTDKTGADNKVSAAKVDKIIGVCEVEDKLEDFPNCLKNQKLRAVVFVNVNEGNYIDRNIAEVFNHEDNRSAYEMTKGKPAVNHDKWVEKLKDAVEVKRNQDHGKPAGHNETANNGVEDDYDF